MILPSVPLCKARNWQQHSEHSREALWQDVPYVAHVLNCNCRQARGKGKGSKEAKGARKQRGKRRCRIGVWIYLHARVFVTVGQ